MRRILITAAAATGLLAAGCASTATHPAPRPSPSYSHAYDRPGRTPVVTPSPVTPKLRIACVLVQVASDGSGVVLPSYRLVLANTTPVPAYVHSWTVDYTNRQGDIVHQQDGAYDPGAAMLVKPWHVRYLTEPTDDLSGLGVTSCQAVGWQQS